MTRALRRAAAVAVALLALPFPAAPFEWNARAGVEYFRSDARSLAGESVSYPRLDVDLGLDAAGALVRPSVFSWNGGVQYRRIDRSVQGLEVLDDQLSYRLRARLFQDPRSPASLSLHASRIEDDFSAGGSSTGAYLQTLYGADLSLSGANRPFLNLGYAFSGTDKDSVALGPSERTIQTLSASTGHGSTNFSYSARYRANLSEGTFASENYDDHRVDVDASVDATASVKVRIADIYFLRQPTTSSPFNPRQELNSLSASVISRGDGRNIQTATYHYVHGLQDVPLAVAPFASTTERARHRVAYLLDRQLPDPEWRIRASAEVAHTEDRLAAVPARTTGESAGAVLFWRRGEKADLFEARAGPTIGVLHPDGGDAVLGYGGTAGVTLHRGAAGALLQLVYDVTYESDLRGVEGWRLAQAVTGSANRPLGRGSLTAMLQASAQRRDSELLGGAASRSLIATGAYRWGRNEVRLQAGLQDGVAGTVADEIGGDALFLTSYDSHVRFAQLGANLSPWRYLAVRGHVRMNSSDLPDRPTTGETEALLGVDLFYGALRIGVEDRYSVFDTGGGTARVNQVLVRLSRSFGSRY